MTDTVYDVVIVGGGSGGPVVRALHRARQALDDRPRPRPIGRLARLCRARSPTSRAFTATSPAASCWMSCATRRLISARSIARPRSPPPTLSPSPKPSYTHRRRLSRPLRGHRNRLARARTRRSRARRVPGRGCQLLRDVRRRVLCRQEQPAWWVMTRPLSRKRCSSRGSHARFIWSAPRAALPARPICWTR